jgi:transposase
MMRVGLFKPVHVKTLAGQEQRMLLTSRKLVQRKLLDIECDMRGTLRNFGLKVGIRPVTLSITHNSLTQIEILELKS